MSGVLVGGILWPSFSDSLTNSHEIMPGEVTLAGIIHNIQLVLSIEIPNLHFALQVKCVLLTPIFIFGIVAYP